MFGNGIRDFDIHREVLAELDWARDVHSTDVGVQVSSGIVTLTGSVSSSDKKVAAVAAAHRVEGVRAVVDAMQVHLPSLDGPTDAEVAREAVNILSGMGSDRVDDIQVTVERGCLIISGRASTETDRREAEQALSRVPGVRRVTNRISTVDPTVNATEVRSRIEHAFQSLAEQAARRITLDVDGPIVILRGTVDTWAERNEAERAALLAGSARIDNQIQVYPHVQVEANDVRYIAG